MQRAARQLSLTLDTASPDELSGFAVRVSGRAKRLSIKVYPRGRVEVVVPRRARPRDVQAFVAEHRDWIDRTREAFAEEHRPEPFALPDAVELAGISRRFRIHYRERPGNVRFRRHGDLLVLSGRTGSEEHCVSALKRWLIALAKAEFEPRLKSLAALTGTRYGRLQVRGQKTCWGSYSSSGTLSLNYCLMFLKPELVRYLMLHELCHARHMNHSRRFWQMVARFEPDCRRLDRELGDSWKHIPTWLGIY